MEFGMINLFGIITVAVMLIPNIIFAVKNKNAVNKCTNKIINTAEQIGRYGSMLLIILPVGMREFGFSSVAAMAVYVICNASLLTAYLILWAFYGKKQTLTKALALALIPTIIFFTSGITLKHWLLVAASILFGISHTAITYTNNK